MVVPWVPLYNMKQTTKTIGALIREISLYMFWVNVISDEMQDLSGNISDC